MKTAFILGLVMFAIQAGAAEIDPSSVKKCLDAVAPEFVDQSSIPHDPLEVNEWNEDYTVMDLSKSNPPTILVTTDAKTYAFPVRHLTKVTSNIVLEFPDHPSIYLTKTQEGVFSLDMFPAKKNPDYVRMYLRPDSNANSMDQAVERRISNLRENYETRSKKFWDSLGRSDTAQALTSDMEGIDQKINENCQQMGGSVEVAKAIQAFHSTARAEREKFADFDLSPKKSPSDVASPVLQPASDTEVAGERN